MRSIFAIVFSIGGVLSLLLTHYAEWWLAPIIFLSIPYAVLYIVERLGYIQFDIYEPIQDRSLISKIVQEDISDEKAADKYGWPVVVEMDERIKQMELALDKAKINREKFAALVKGNL